MKEVKYKFEDEQLHITYEEDIKTERPLEDFSEEVEYLYYLCHGDTGMLVEDGVCYFDNSNEWLEELEEELSTQTISGETEVIDDDKQLYAHKIQYIQISKLKNIKHIKFSGYCYQKHWEFELEDYSYKIVYNKEEKVKVIKSPKELDIFIATCGNTKLNFIGEDYISLSKLAEWLSEVKGIDKKNKITVKINNN